MKRFTRDWVELVFYIIILAFVAAFVVSTCDMRNSKNEHDNYNANRRIEQRI